MKNENSTQGYTDDNGIGVRTNSLAAASGMLRKWVKTTVPKFIEEKSVPDLWQMAATGNAITSLVGEDDTPFTGDEQVR